MTNNAASMEPRRVVPPRSWRDHALVQLTFVRIREFLREPEAVFWAIAFPVLLAAGLGVAFRNESGEVVPVAAVTGDLAAALSRDSRLKVQTLTPEQAGDALRTGQIVMVVERTADGGVTYRYDDTNPQGRSARVLVDQAVQIAAGRTDPVGVVEDLVREPGSRYIDFLVPGLVGMGIMGNAIWGLGFSIVDARRRKLMKRIIATPMPRHYYLLSFLAWRMLLLVAEVGVPVAFGAFIFGVPFRGHFIEFAAIAVFGSLAFSALGLLIASRARTIEAASGLMNFVMLPMWILSGVFFSAQRFPDALQPVVRALPLTALNDALRANMLQGTPLIALWPSMATLAVYLVVCFVLALKLFRWR